MASLLLTLGLSFAFSFLVTYAATPFIAEKMLARGIFGLDMNKASKKKVAEMGGIAVWMGLAAGILVAIFSFSYLNSISMDLTLLLAGFSTMLLVGFLGVIDDLIGWRKGLQQWQHAIVPVFAALPLMAVKATNPPIVLPLIGLVPSEYLLPFFGIVSFGAIYSLIMVPVGVTGASNATNMLAGLNGLEAGLGAIIFSTLLAISVLEGRVESAVICAAILAALVAFLRFNWFPAKVFGGDSLTLMIGSGIAAVVIIGNMEKIGVMLMLLYFFELVLKARHGLKLESFGVPTKEGWLKPPKETSSSITHVIMRRGNFSEKGVVSVILAMQLVVSAAVFTIYYLKLFWFLA